MKIETLSFIKIFWNVTLPNVMEVAGFSKLCVPVNQTKWQPTVWWLAC